MTISTKRGSSSINLEIFFSAESNLRFDGTQFVGDLSLAEFSLTQDFSLIGKASLNAFSFHDVNGTNYGGASYMSILTMLDERVMEAPQNVIWDAASPNGFGIQKSTRKLKHDIIDLDFDADEFFKYMRPVSFKWNGTERLDSGFIAEEVAEFDSRLVAWMPSKDEESGEDIMEVSSVNYDKVTAYLVKVVGDLREEVKSLKDEIEKLK